MRRTGTCGAASAGAATHSVAGRDAAACCSGLTPTRVPAMGTSGERELAKTSKASKGDRWDCRTELGRAWCIGEYAGSAGVAGGGENSDTASRAGVSTRDAGKNARASCARRRGGHERSHGAHSTRAAQRRPNALVSSMFGPSGPYAAARARLFVDGVCIGASGLPPQQRAMPWCPRSGVSALAPPISAPQIRAREFPLPRLSLISFVRSTRAHFPAGKKHTFRASAPCRIAHILRPRVFRQRLHRVARHSA